MLHDLTEGDDANMICLKGWMMLHDLSEVEG